MSLDVTTIFVVSVFVAALSGALLLFTWNQSRALIAQAVWGCAHLVLAVGLALLAMRGHIPDLLSVGVANALIVLVAGISWNAARLFEGRGWQLPGLAAGPVVWLGACLIPAFHASFETRVVLASAIVAGYTTLTAWEFWKGRAEELPSRIPVVVLLLVHAGLVVVRIPASFLAPSSAGGQLLTTWWMPIAAFAALLYVVSMSFLLLSMAKERSELDHKVEARVDPLTGAANRRDFLERASRLMRRGSRGRGTALIMFDLDRFKAVNDSFGHQFGDEVLRRFVDIARDSLRDADLFGRLGGEEFAAVLPGASAGDAFVAAERVRRAFAEVGREIGGRAVNATVSAGVARFETGSPTLEALMERADKALYRAKAMGRDRVEVSLAREGRQAA